MSSPTRSDGTTTQSTSAIGRAGRGRTGHERDVALSPSSSSFTVLEGAWLEVEVGPVDEDVQGPHRCIAHSLNRRRHASSAAMSGSSDWSIRHRGAVIASSRTWTPLNGVSWPKKPKRLRCRRSAIWAGSGRAASGRTPRRRSCRREAPSRRTARLGMALGAMKRSTSPRCDWMKRLRMKKVCGETSGKHSWQRRGDSSMQGSRRDAEPSGRAGGRSA